MIAHHGLLWTSIAADPPAGGTDRDPVRRRHLAGRVPPAARCPPEVGNNARGRAALGLERGEAFGEHRDERSASSVTRARDPLRRAARPLRATFGKRRSSGTPAPRSYRLGILSGSAASSLSGDRARSGRLSHRRTGRACDGRRENHVHFIAGGHYATRRSACRLGGSWPSASESSTASSTREPHLSLAERPTFARGLWLRRPVHPILSLPRRYSDEEEAYMAIHLTPTELAERRVHRREVILKCMKWASRSSRVGLDSTSSPTAQAGPAEEGPAKA